MPDRVPVDSVQRKVERAWTVADGEALTARTSTNLTRDRADLCLFVIVCVSQ